ncbi:MAG TPA: site-specific integrase [Solirubrobacteraceae bacterium]|nr:site-specific integrase [Solirubrobacteraceae bacterium]
MKGSTRKRGKTWTAYWWVSRLDQETGQLGRQQRSQGGFRIQKDAQAFLNEKLSSLATGTYVEPDKQPLAEFMAKVWLPGISGTVRPLTAFRYERIIRNYITRRDIGAVPLRHLTGGHMNALYAELEREGLSIATRRLVHAVIRRALNDAIRWRKLARNPAAEADPPSAPTTRAQSWTGRELRIFLGQVADDRLFALWRLAATTGMRRGELLGLPWRCVDLEGGKLRVEQQLLPTKGGVTFGPPKSKRGERTVALDPETVEALRRHRDVQVLERDLAGPGYEDHDLVFADELGRPIYPSRLGEWFVKARKDAGIPTGTLHVLRHTAATIALTERVPLHIVAGRIGDDPKTVLATYAHLLPHSDAEAAAVVAAAIVDRPLTNNHTTEVERVD